MEEEWRKEMELEGKKMETEVDQLKIKIKQGFVAIFIVGWTFLYYHSK